MKRSSCCHHRPWWTSACRLWNRNTDDRIAISTIPVRLRSTGHVPQPHTITQRWALDKTHSPACLLRIMVCRAHVQREQPLYHDRKDGRDTRADSTPWPRDMWSCTCLKCRLPSRTQEKLFEPNSVQPFLDQWQIRVSKIKKRRNLLQICARFLEMYFQYLCWFLMGLKNNATHL